LAGTPLEAIQMPGKRERLTGIAPDRLETTVAPNHRRVEHPDRRPGFAIHENCGGHNAAWFIGDVFFVCDVLVIRGTCS
jgi:hypothetical protein